MIVGRQSIRRGPVLTVIQVISEKDMDPLIVYKKRRVGQVVSPGSQQRVLSDIVGLQQYRYESGTYVFAYEATIPTCTSVSVGHDQHIPRLCK